jgi:hypothetical protein
MKSMDCGNAKHRPGRVGGTSDQTEFFGWVLAADIVTDDSSLWPLGVND